MNSGHQVSVSPQLDFVEDNKSEQMPPKIHGVRVIVDAKNLKGKYFFRSEMVCHQPSIISEILLKGMDKEPDTIRIQTMDGAKQTVGIHTDITFEIDDKKNSSKAATDGKNAESEETEDEVPIYRGTHTDGDRYDPNGYGMNQPGFHAVNDEDETRYGDSGVWIRFLPSSNGGWTTERYSESFKPQSM